MRNESTQILLTPFTLGDLVLRNRMIMAPLTRARAENCGHVPTDLMREYYQQRASAGLIVTEGVFVSEQGQGWYGVPGIYNLEQGRAWENITDAVHSEGGLIFAQLWHQGAVSHPSLLPDGMRPIGPSAVNPEQPVHLANGVGSTEVPREMTRNDISQAVREFRQAAQVAKDAGFDGVQIQAGFVYLIQQFLHETTNRRTDTYGGGIENRARFLFEVLEAVLEVWPANRVGIKSGPMMNEQGAMKATPQTLPTLEYVYRSLSLYGLSHLLLMRQMAGLTNTPLASMAGDAVVHHFRNIYNGTLIINAGLSAEHAARLIEGGTADLVAFGRDYISNPDLVERIAIGSPLSPYDPSKFYNGDHRGYTDYGFLATSTLSTLND